MRIIHNQALRSKLVQVPHECGLAGAPISSQRQAKGRKELVAQRLRLDACPGVGDPIDAFAHLLESLRFGVCARMPLHPECEPGLAALGRSLALPSSRRVRAWLWLPIH